MFKDIIPILQKLTARQVMFTLIFCALTYFFIDGFIQFYNAQTYRIVELTRLTAASHQPDSVKIVHGGIMANEIVNNDKKELAEMPGTK